MNYVKQAIFAISLMLVGSAINAGGDVSAPAGKLARAKAYVSEKAIAGKNAVVDLYNAHPKKAKGGICALVTAAAVGTAYKYSGKVRSAMNNGAAKVKSVANDYVVTPVKNMSRNAKIASVGTAVAAVAAYFGGPRAVGFVKAKLGKK